ncbi:MAG: hypothetical protein HY951_05175 [Bacteroidia bacterium]|nr:hypothetical protein [Bacteroidia bacterium]
MNNLFKSIAIIVFLAITIFSVPSCKKYSEGPFFSLISRTERVSNTWKVDNYKFNGNDYTSLVTNYTETYTKNGNYSYNWSAISGTGTWAFQNKDAEIKITGIDNQSTVTLFIIKLEEKQFWYYYMDGTDKKEYHMIQL